jgi:4-hydroxy-3-polyprenylbenzoate decarboxylase
MLLTTAQGQTRSQMRQITSSRPIPVEGFFSRLRLAFDMHTVVGITGASGTVYGARLLRAFPGKTTVVVSEDGLAIAREELGMTRKGLHALALAHYDNDDLFSPLASGSVGFDAMVIAPCSASTMSKIACGIGDNLITRVASVALKEHRRLVLVVRETPLSAIHLGNMERLAAAGAVVMPACPAFYPRPKSVEDMVDFVVGRVLDVLGVENDIYRRWDGGGGSRPRSRGSRRTRR